MSQPRVKWIRVRRYFSRSSLFNLRGGKGGDKVITGPHIMDPTGPHSVVTIGHRYSDHPGREITNAHVSRIFRAFGVTRQDILNS